MRRTPWLLAMLLLLLVPAAAHAAEAQCPLPLTECLMQYQRMRERPWLGVSVEMDSVTHQRVIRSVEPGSPAHRAGIHPGDVILAKYVGVHMLEGHLAYMHGEEHDAEHH